MTNWSTGLEIPGFVRTCRPLQAALAQRMQELDARISEVYSQGLPWQDLGQEYEQLRQAHDQVCFVDRAQMLMAQGVPAKIATAVADTEVLSWIKQARDGYEEAAQQFIAKHEKDAEDVVHFAAQMLMDAWPETRNCKTVAEVQRVIETIRQRDPAYASWIDKNLGNFQRAVANCSQVREQRERVEKEKFQTWATNQDNIFRSRNREFISPETQKTVALEAFAYLEEKGITRDEVIKLHDEDPLFRSHVGQEILWEALQWRQLQKAKANLPNKRYRESTQTLKPGSAERYLEPREERLPASFSGRQSGLREAAAILSNRRARKR
jgi:hypothetical protein